MIRFSVYGMEDLTRKDVQPPSDSAHFLKTIYSISRVSLNPKAFDSKMFSFYEPCPTLPPLGGG